MFSALCFPMVRGPIPVVCLDPGHPSEVGRGTQGKQISELTLVWKVAQRLRSTLEAGGMKVVMTKHSPGEYVTNIQRAEIANQANANLMLRLHCDASANRGFTVFAPARPGTYQGKTGPTPEIIRRSMAAGEQIHRALQRNFKNNLCDNGLQSDSRSAIGGRYGALIGSIYSQVPVVLVEMFTLNNPNGGKTDEPYAVTSAGQAAMVAALAEGVRAALEDQKLRKHW